MNLKDLISSFRVDADDKVEPYFWTDEDVTRWLNEAVAEAAIRGRLMHESSNADMCCIAVIAGQSVYPIHSAMIELDYVAFMPTGVNHGNPIYLTSQENLNEVMPRWRTETGDPRFAIQSDKTLRLAPTPVRTGVIALEGYRLPKSDMADPEDIPEINAAHHRHLVQWALARAFKVPDTEVFDPNRAAIAESEFTKYFGERPDADLRRQTREDFPHHVLPFWP